MRPWIAFVAAVVVAVGATPAVSTPEPIARPVLDNLEGPDRELVERERRALDDLLASGLSEGEELATAYGRVGRLYLVHDLVLAAREAFDRAVELEPDRLDLWYFLGVIAQREGELDVASEALEKARMLAPNDIAVAVRQGQVAQSMGATELAVMAFERALEANSRSAAAFYGLGRSAAARGETEEAIDRFETALELQPSATAIHHPLGLAYRQIGDLEKAREHLAANTHATVRFRDPLMDDLGGLLRGGRALSKAGNQAIAQGRWELALTFYERAEAASPGDPLPVYNIGWLQARAGRRLEAITTFERALELDPEYRDAHYNLASVLTELGRVAEASRHFEAAYRIDPLDHAAHLDWAISLARTGDRRRAEQELRSIVAAIPPSEVVLASRVHLSLAQLADASGRQDEAIEWYRSGLGLDDGDVEAAERLARLVGQRGRFGEAADWLAVVVAARPSDVEAWFGRVMALLLAEREVEAADAGREGLEAVPSSVPIAHLLARVLATAGEQQARDGEHALELATRVTGQARTPDHLETVAMALAELGRFDEAIATQESVMAELRRQGASPPRLAMSTSRLDAYRRGEPCRRPWSGS